MPHLSRAYYTIYRAICRNAINLDQRNSWNSCQSFILHI